MPRPLKNNPLGLPEKPNIPVDPSRLAEITSLVSHALNDVLLSFSNARSMEAKYGTINDSIDRVRRTAKRKRPSKTKQKLLHPIVTWRINELARAIAVKRTGDADAIFNAADVKDAALQFSETVPIKRGRPADQTLWNHVELLMALLQRAVGQPVLARRSEGSVYRMFFEDEKAQRIFDALHDIDPNITEAQVADIIIKLRRKYAGREMSFGKLAREHGIIAQSEFRKHGFDAPMFERAMPIFSIYSP